MFIFNSINFFCDRKLDCFWIENKEQCIFTQRTCNDVVVALDYAGQPQRTIYTVLGIRTTSPAQGHISPGKSKVVWENNMNLNSQGSSSLTSDYFLKLKGPHYTECWHHPPTNRSPNSVNWFIMKIIQLVWRQLQLGLNAFLWFRFIFYLYYY